MKDRIHVHQDGKLIYDIVFKNDFSELKKELEQAGFGKNKKACIISDSNVAPLYLEALQELLGDYFSFRRKSLLIVLWHLFLILCVFQYLLQFCASIPAFHSCTVL